MIQLFMKRSGSPVIVPLRFPASQSAITEASCQLDEASREGKTEIVEIKSVIANLPSYLGGLDPDSRTQLAQLNQLSSIIAKMDSRERNIYAGALDGNSINDLNDMIRVAEQVSDYILIPNVNSDVTLGRYVAVAGQIQGDPRFPEAAWPYLDFAKIGAEYYAEHGGAYTYAGYVLRKQDDELVREKKSKIQLDLSSSQAQVSICLPATKEELERVKRTLGIDCFAEAAVTKVSFSVPYMDEHIPTTGGCVEDANELAWAIEGMQCEDGELLKYLSVLSVMAVFPLLWIVLCSVKKQGELLSNPTKLIPSAVTLDNFKNVLINLGFLNNIGNSIIIAFSSTLITITISALGAYGIVRFYPRFGKLMTRVLITGSAGDW